MKDLVLFLVQDLSDLSNVMEIKEKIPYENIPGFPKCTVEGHEGNLIIAEISGVPIIGLAGRKHFYEVDISPQTLAYWMWCFQ